MSDTVAALIEALGHQQQGRPALAERIYSRVLEHEPDQPNALYLYGLLQLRDGRAPGAAALLQRAARLRPDMEVQLHLARACLAAGRPGCALAAAGQALAIGGRRAETLYVQGTALNGCGRAQDAHDALAEAVALDPCHAAARLNLGNALADLDRLPEAEAQIRTALQLDPTLVEAHASLGFVLAALGRLDAAIGACEQAIALDDDNGEAHWNLATALLLRGDFPRGFQEYEWRKRHPRFRHAFGALAGPAWTGGDLRGQTLLVQAEQGLGDTIQLARYMPELASRGARVVLACSPALAPLLAGQPGLTQVVPVPATVPATVPLPPHDLWVDQMSLPRLLGTTTATIPYPEGYLRADPARQQAWANWHLTPEARTRPGFTRIGLAWAGNPLHSNDRRRSLPLHALQALARPGMISLQLGPRTPEAHQLGLLTPLLETPLPPDYAETAALVATLDLVITVDTSVAHLAGALGIPVWIMLPHAPDWRWIQGREDTPWYRSARLFRQPAPNDWPAVVAQVHQALVIAMAHTG